MKVQNENFYEDELRQDLVIEQAGICDECGASLPKPKREVREGGQVEFVTECPKCGATYIN